MHLFAYGTLMCEEIMIEVSGCLPTHVPGTLRGYCRREIKGEHFPALMPEEKGCVTGMVFLDIPPQAWPRLDQYEGDMYQRQTVKVELADGAFLQAATYVVRPGYLDHLKPDDWDYEGFLCCRKTRFLEEYRMSLSK